jgi:hypothetical protein
MCDVVLSLLPLDGVDGIFQVITLDTFPVHSFMILKNL